MDDVAWRKYLVWAVDTPISKERFFPWPVDQHVALGRGTLTPPPHDRYATAAWVPWLTGSGVDPFFGWGGGGGGKSKKKFNFIFLFNFWILCMFSSIFMLILMFFFSAWQCLKKPNLFLHYTLLIFQVVEIIGGGGGKTKCLPPQYFHLGRLPPSGSTLLLTGQGHQRGVH